MIPNAYITAWRSQAPWGTDAQVEQDLVLLRAIIAIFSEPFLNSELAFRGGTAIHKLVLKTPGRYSEDLDLVQVKAGAAGKIMQALHDCFDGWLGKPSTTQNSGRITFIYRFESEIAPIIPMRLKVEINTREHFSVLGLKSHKFAVNSPWFTGSTEVITYAIEELLATKLRALYQRKKGRDLFDLYLVLRSLPATDIGQVLDCFHKYMAHQKLKVSRAQFESNLALKLEDPAFLKDINSLLATETMFDAVEASNFVSRTLISRLPGKPWRGEK